MEGTDQSSYNLLNDVGNRSSMSADPGIFEGRSPLQLP